MPVLSKRQWDTLPANGTRYGSVQNIPVCVKFEREGEREREREMERMREREREREEIKRGTE